MFWMFLIIRTIVGAIVGWVVGLMLSRIMFAIDNWRLKRKTKKTDDHEYIVAEFGPIVIK